MVKLVALYKKPADPEDFLVHFYEVHVPLVRKTPGLVKLEASSVKANAFGGEAPYFLIVEMSYPDPETFKTAMRSDENRAFARDTMEFAKDLVTVMVCEIVNV